MLFNTLAYAKFFGVVFLVAWLLVSRRWALTLPWFALAGYVLMGDAGWLGGVLALGALLLTLGLCWRQENDVRPSVPRTVASVALNTAALALLTYRDHATDPLSLSLAALDVPVGTGLGWSLPVLLVGAILSLWLIRAKKVRLLFILGASYVFYAHWDWRFLPLIFGSSSADWLLGHAIGRSEDPRRRKLWLVATIVLNLGVLGIFKYFNFGIETMQALLASLGLHAPETTLRIALPIGISFFTFESMSYVIDVYRRELEPHESYFEYLSFVAFFPHLVAGPIVRPRDLLPQLAGPARWNSAEGSEALFLIAVGLLKKVAIGDYLAVNLVDRVFDSPVSFSAVECYASVLGYAVQIYCDFSGYTDIAIGSALLLGVRFPLNFNSPYKATNIADFWRRWHISLSTWLRDYLYISLGGNRRGRARTYINLMLTMLLGGLWHGASWTFVVWGGIHGVGLAVTRAVADFRRKAGRSAGPAPRWWRWLTVLGTFHLVCAAWIFFRAPTFQGAWQMYAQLSTLTAHHANLPWQVIAVLAVGLVSHWLPARCYSGTLAAFVRLPAPLQALALLAVAWVLRQMASAEAVPFVYFQF